ncbi:MAG: nucleoside/nucleotide kinase family protein [Planctomycetota bacterium]
MGVGVILNDAGLDGLTADLVERCRASATGSADRRALVLLAGPPGSGKSTLAARLAESVGQALPGGAAWAPMDGHHLPQAELDRRGLAERKGAPETFNARGFIDGLRRMLPAGRTGVFATYDRRLGEPVVGSQPSHRVTASTGVLLAEGNYLLLEALPWGDLRELAAEAWYLDAPWEACCERLRRRHAERGRSPAEIEAKLKHDRRNFKLVAGQSRHADRVLRWPCEAGA